MTRRLALALLLVLVARPIAGQPVSLPNRPGSLKIAVIGDSGTGKREQYEVAAQMTESRARFAFDLVLMLGDNLYGGKSPRDYQKKFELPYKPLLDAGVRFYAALGNHDTRDERRYAPFNMGGRTYYSVAAPAQSVRFFALESGEMNAVQLRWIAQELAASTERWKIVFMHHPIYSSGRRHGSDTKLQRPLEPLFVQHGVSAVFAGHDHLYERLRPQNGIAHFVSGGAAKLRKNGLRRGSPLTAAGFDTDRHFMLVEIDGDEMFIEAIARTGVTVDRAIVPRRIQ